MRPVVPWSPIRSLPTSNERTIQEPRGTARLRTVRPAIRQGLHIGSGVSVDPQTPERRISPLLAPRVEPRSIPRDSLAPPQSTATDDMPVK
jgi:hypothetical protein